MENLIKQIDRILDKLDKYDELFKEQNDLIHALDKKIDNNNFESSLADTKMKELVETILEKKKESQFAMYAKIIGLIVSFLAAAEAVRAYVVGAFK